MAPWSSEASLRSAPTMPGSKAGGAQAVGCVTNSQGFGELLGTLLSWNLLLHPWLFFLV